MDADRFDEKLRAFKLWKQQAEDFQKSQWENLKGRKFDSVPVDDLEMKVRVALHLAGESTSPEQDLAVSKLASKINEFAYRKPGRPYTTDIGVVYVNVYLENSLSESGIDVLFRCKYSKTTYNNWSFEDRLIDINLRIYRDWDDYLRNNTLPQGEMCFPEKGDYSSSTDLKTVIKPTPASNQILLKLDSLFSVGGLLASGVLVTSLFVSLPLTLVRAALAVKTVTSAYEVSRNVSKLIDRLTHLQDISLQNPVARRIWINFLVSVVETAVTGTTYRNVSTPSALTFASLFAIKTSVYDSRIAVSCGVQVLSQLLSNAIYRYDELDDRKLNTIRDIACFSLNVFIPSNQQLKLIMNDLKEIIDCIAVIAVKCEILKCGNVTVNSAKTLKEVLHIGGEFMHEISLADYEGLCQTVFETLKCMGKSNILQFESRMKECCQNIWLHFEKSWQKAEYKFSSLYSAHAFDKVDLDREALRKAFSALNKIIESFDVSPKRNIANEMKKLTGLVNKFCAQKKSGSDCTTNEFLSRINFFCLYLKREIQIRSSQSPISYYMENEVEILSREFESRERPTNEHHYDEILDSLNSEEGMDKLVKEYNKFCKKRNKKTNAKSNKVMPSLKIGKTSTFLFIEPVSGETVNHKIYWKILKDRAGLELNDGNAKLNFRGNLICVEPRDKNVGAIKNAWIYVTNRGQYERRFTNKSSSMSGVIITES